MCGKHTSWWGRLKRNTAASERLGSTHGWQFTEGLKDDIWVFASHDALAWVRGIKAPQCGIFTLLCSHVLHMSQLKSSLLHMHAHTFFPDLKTTAQRLMRWPAKWSPVASREQTKGFFLALPVPNCNVGSTPDHCLRSTFFSFLKLFWFLFFN